MKNYKEVVEIDVSKKTIDAYCYQVQVSKECKNDTVGYKSMKYLQKIIVSEKYVDNGDSGWAWYAGI
ncbi:hypothetical protein BTO04_02440 [Polaribacter sp. SA4-10]|uniref:hypothetical protein n=1 Tax=Polaribacter sp. SA4-10 TaxID=754397 RepID=UPI000B3D009C|nr:hypothetical protein [Polaribacter sp. SA4-10]ARV05625.1 hypothetical protein BTO04_02440 [Polaribacter sp. SA4-10]